MYVENKAPVTSMSSSLLAREVYAVCFPERESVETLDDALADLRRRFFTGGRKTVRTGKNVASGGYTGKLKGKMSGRRLYWKKTAGSVPAEESFDQRNGCLVVRRDMQGNIVSRIFFDRSHIWIKSEYYDLWDPNNPAVIFKPVASSDLVERFDWDEEKKRFRCTELFPLEYKKGSAEESLLAARFGDPPFLVSSENGVYCYCGKQDAQERLKAQEEIQDGNIVLMPAWQVRDGSLSGEEEPEDSKITFTSLEEYAQVVPEKEVKPESAPVAPPEVRDTLEFSLADVLAAEAASAAEASTAEPVPNEETSVPAAEPAVAEESETPVFEAESEPAPVEQLDEPVLEEPVPDEAPLESSPVEEAAAEEAPAVEAPREPASVSEEREVSELEEIADRVLSEQSEKTSPPDDLLKETSAPLESLVARVVSQGSVAQESHPVLRDPVAAAQGETRRFVSDGVVSEIQVVSRPVNQLGQATYEGEYANGKREGFGAHYDQGGNLSYAGSWKEDRKNGLGVSFRSSDHALHIANWEDGKPGSYVTLFDKDGNLRYSGRIIDGKKQGAGVAVNPRDGTVFVGKWENGEPTGFGSSFDQQGNLLYYGNWANGKRNGHGTEFDVNGSIIFDGEWKDDKYHNGILYQKQSEGDAGEDPAWD